MIGFTTSDGKVFAVDLKECLQESWSKETSADPKKWTADNPAWGQCAVTTLVAQDFYGGNITRLDLSGAPDPEVAAMRSHYFNCFNGQNVDYSISQFPCDTAPFPREHLVQSNDYLNPLLTPQNLSERTREQLLANEETKRRYKILRLAVAKKLASDNPLFTDPIFRKCLELALESDCQKGKYGCVAVYQGKIIAEDFNKILESLRDWCTPECMRKSIPSRTESMLGACGHAEEFVLATVRDSEADIKEVKFFVSGFRSNGLAYIKSEADSTCIRCAMQFYMHGVEKTYVPVKTGWEMIGRDEVITGAKDYALQIKTLKNYGTRQ